MVGKNPDQAYATEDKARKVVCSIKESKTDIVHRVKELKWKDTYPKCTEVIR